ncbi:hypothetical protein GALMADRAFT_724755 [Galerina marginata CBS 339.88]|uniref:NACHT domain-containing protein n=1 Tax=Galerina marginata (strain CBS 339.88) TaxID=685588 RepID=A0A067SQH3_GALM3|nr:hypothetical protein GALMADRAFT_724755 [Galerina marginata CBS 339.88]
MFSGLNSLLITGGTFVQQTDHPLKTPFQCLEEATAPGAFHNSADRFDPPRCHPDTRTAIIKRVVDWVLGVDASVQERRAFMQWLYGSAGVGKSAIAQTVAEICEDNDSLLACFFFSRADHQRNNARLLVATIAYQIALNNTQAKQIILAAVKQDPLIFSKSLHVQFAHLVFQPIRLSMHANSSRHLIIIDGLDECEDQQIRCDILRLLTTSFQQHSLPVTLQVLITSRPELDILSFINLQSLDSGVDRLALDGERDSNRDIRLFLEHRFNRIKIIHPHRTFIPAEWPSLNTIDSLVQKASGQFIYASTVVKYISSLTHNPTSRLDIILGLCPVIRGAPFADLDELYRHIFSTVEDLGAVLQVIGLIILGRQPLTREIELILGLNHGDIELLLSPLAAIVAIDKKTDFVRILHASLDDFLLDNVRSKDLYIYPAMKHAQYAQMCLRRLATANTVSQHHPGSCPPNMSLFCALAHHFPKAFPIAELREEITDVSLKHLYACWVSFASAETEGLSFFYSGFMANFLSFIQAALSPVLAMGRCTRSI